VALKRVVNDVSTLAIEECLISKLPRLFRPEMIHELSDAEVSKLASETEDTKSQRERCIERLAVLEAGMHDLKSLDRYRSGIQSTSSYKVAYQRSFLTAFLDPNIDSNSSAWKSGDDSSAKQSASNTDITPGESSAAVEENLSAPNTVIEVAEEGSPGIDATRESNDFWAPLGKKKGKKAKKPMID